MPYVEEKIEINGDINELFTLISDVTLFPDFMEDVKSVEILEEGDGWKISEWVNIVDGRTIQWTEKDFILPDKNRVNFELVKGDLKSYSGFWQLENKPDDPATVDVTFAIDFEFGMPVIAVLIHPILARVLRNNMKQMLQAVKDEMEKIPILSEK